MGDTQGTQRALVRTHKHHEGPPRGHGDTGTPIGDTEDTDRDTQGHMDIMGGGTGTPTGDTQETKMTLMGTHGHHGGDRGHPRGHCDRRHPPTTLVCPWHQCAQ